MKRNAIYLPVVVALSLTVFATTNLDCQAPAFQLISSTHEMLGEPPIDDFERQSLLQMREEEKLARDVYIKLYEKWGSRPFANIKESEQRHMDAVLELMNTHHIDDPAKQAAIGEFRNERLQLLYNSLIEKGMKSQADAYEVGATIEDLDLYDLQLAMKKINNPAITAVYDNLARGSRNHLRAFVRNLGMAGTGYKVQYISQQQFDSIIAGQQERGW